MKSRLFKVINPPLGTTGPIYFRRAEPDGTVIQLSVGGRTATVLFSGYPVGSGVFAAEITDCCL
ncbi:hypothetical protein GT030_04780 [Streptomyces sp. SID1328]|nr:hypothetical protein [Streptomyces sp. SID1328]